MTGQELTSKARAELIYWIRTGRLVGASLREYVEGISREEAQKVTKAGAYKLIEDAEAYAYRLINKAIEEKEATETNAMEARRAVAELSEEIKKQAEELKQ